MVVWYPTPYLKYRHGKPNASCQLIWQIKHIYNLTNMSQNLIWVYKLWTNLPFLPKPHNTLHGWDFQIDPIMNNKIKIPPSNIDKRLLLTLEIHNLSLISQMFSITSCTNSKPIRETSPTSNNPIRDLHLLQ